MRCPFCAYDNSQVKDSRPTEDNTAIRRRRQCDSCGARFTTFERVQLREITVVKSDGTRENFDRTKIEQSVALASRKRGIAQEPLDFGYKEWTESVNFPYKQLGFMRDMVTGMPIQTPAYSPPDSGFGSAAIGGLAGLSLYNKLFG